MGWLYMIVNIAAAVVFYGVKPDLAFGASLALLAVSFATFCLLYDAPVNRARNRIAQQLARVSSHGIHAEEHQRLQSQKITATEQDKQFQLTFMSGVNIASGIAGGIMLAWGLFARFA